MTRRAVTRHGVCVQARHERCDWCHALREQPCAGCGTGVHFCRVGLAADHGSVTMRDKAVIMHELGVCGGWSLVPDEVSA